MFWSHLEENFTSSQNLSCGIRALHKRDGKCTFVLHNHITTSVCLGKGQRGSGPWSISVQGLDLVHPSCGAGARGEMVDMASMPLADPGTCTICSRAIHQSCLNRQALLTHSRFRGGYVAKMKDYEMKGELINLSEVKGRQGCVPQAVQGHSDPPLPHGLSLLTDTGKCCRNKSLRAKFRLQNTDCGGLFPYLVSNV